MKRIAFVVLVTLSISVLGAHTSPVHAEDAKRWKVVDSNGNVLAGVIVEGLPSFYSTYVINFDPGGVSPNRCANGCTFMLDSYQNVEGTTSTSSTSTTTTISGGSNSGTTNTTTQRMSLYMSIASIGVRVLEFLLVVRVKCSLSERYFITVRLCFTLAVDIGLQRFQTFVVVG